MLSLNRQGVLKGDDNADGILSYSEMVNYLWWYTLTVWEHDENITDVVYEADFGEPVPVDTLELTPTFVSSADFDGSISYHDP